MFRGRDLSLSCATRWLGLEPRPSLDRLLDALVAAGELECALTDTGSELAVRAAAISDAVAGMLVRAASTQQTGTD